MPPIQTQASKKLNKKILAWRSKGLTFQAIGKKVGLTKVSIFYRWQKEKKKLEEKQ